LLFQVLLIDEAYRLSEGPLAQEAIDELVDCLTKERYKGRLIVILAGYNDDINRLLKANRGLGSRFAEEITFEPLQPEGCFDLLVSLLKKEDVELVGLESVQMVSVFRELAQLPSWGNARDVETLAKKMTALAFRKIVDSAPTATIQLDTLTALGCMQDALKTSMERASSGPLRILSHDFAQSMSAPSSVPPIDITPSSEHSVTASTQAFTLPPVRIPGSEQKIIEQKDGDVARDAGVSDDVWEELQRDRRAAEACIQKLEEVAQRVREAEEEERRQLAEELRQMEEARREEEAVQRKIQEMGVCVSGYAWIQQESGYRCQGGAHFLDNSQLGI
jgi:predicted ribosome quality control (RQC) complex YloA/Tae2 family protein